MLLLGFAMPTEGAERPLRRRANWQCRPGTAGRERRAKLTVARSVIKSPVTRGVVASVGSGRPGACRTLPVQSGRLRRC